MGRRPSQSMSELRRMLYLKVFLLFDYSKSSGLHVFKSRLCIKVGFASLYSTMFYHQNHLNNKHKMMYTKKHRTYIG